MKNTLPWITVSSVLAAALLGLLPPTTGFAQSYAIRPTCPCATSGQCKPNTATFGFNDTNWREWPVQPRPEEQNPGAVGSHRIPTPPEVLQQALPHAEGLPTKPPLSGAPILPAPGSIPGPATTPESAFPSLNLQPPTSKGIQGLVPDLSPQPETSPKTDGTGSSPPPSSTGPLPPAVAPLSPLKDSVLPGTVPEALPPGPVAPAAEPPKALDQPAPMPKSSILSPDLAPIPTLKPPQASPDQGPATTPKPEEPLPEKPTKGTALTRRQKDAVAAQEGTIQNNLPMQADWNASLGPEAVGDNHLRNASYEQAISEKRNTPVSGLQGYCPVQLQEHNRWVAGNPDLQMAYEGQVYHFSSEAARSRFQADPEKYAPVQGGNDVVLKVEENRSVPGTANHSALWQGRLYLFSNSATLATFHEDPARYSSTTQHARLQLPADPLGSGN